MENSADENWRASNPQTVDDDSVLWIRWDVGPFEFRMDDIYEFDGFGVDGGDFKLVGSCGEEGRVHFYKMQKPYKFGVRFVDVKRDALAWAMGLLVEWSAAVTSDLSAMGEKNA